jgi:hypothetical protein
MSSMPLKSSLCYSVALATVATATLAPVASAAIFNFSFSNVTGPVNGTVQGTLTLPNGDGTFSASAATITSAPAALGYTTPLPLDFGSGTLFENTFTVVAGQINATASNFFYIFPSFDNAIALNGTDFGANGSSFFDASSGGFLGDTGVRDPGNSTLTYSRVPEPATVLGLLSVAGVGLLCKGRKLEK